MFLFVLQLVMKAFYCAYLIYLVTEWSLKEFIGVLSFMSSGKNEATNEQHWVVIVKHESGKCSR